MAEVHIQHIHNCSEETFWEIFFTEEYSQRLFKEGLGFPVFEQRSFEETTDEIRRVVYVMPKVGQLPGPLKKVIGDGIGYEEHGVFRKSARRLEIDIVPNKMPDRLTLHGVFYTEPISERSSRRLFDCTVKAKVFGVGGMLEKRLIADMQANYDDSAKFTNRYIAEKGL